MISFEAPEKLHEYKSSKKIIDGLLKDEKFMASLKDKKSINRTRNITGLMIQDIDLIQMELTNRKNRLESLQENCGALSGHDYRDGVCYQCWHKEPDYEKRIWNGRELVLSKGTN